MRDLINIDKFEQLSLIAWNRAEREIEGRDAFSLYERNWRFIDVNALTLEEKNLIQRLTDQYGMGVLNV